MTEDEAVLRCQDGDRDAFRYLVEQYKDVLHGTAYLMTGNRALAEEQVQEAFLSAWQGIRGFQLGRPFKPWLVRILINAVLGQRRRRALTTVPLEESDRPEDSPSVDEAVEALADRQSVRRALTGLPPDQRQVVVLRYFAGPDGPPSSPSHGDQGRDRQVAATPVAAADAAPVGRIRRKAG